MANHALLMLNLFHKISPTMFLTMSVSHDVPHHVPHDVPEDVTQDEQLLDERIILRIRLPPPTSPPRRKRHASPPPPPFHVRGRDHLLGTVLLLLPLRHLQQYVISEEKFT